jgi:hypothetical protein
LEIAKLIAVRCRHRAEDGLGAQLAMVVAARFVDKAQRRACRLLASANHILSRLRSFAVALSDIFTANLFTANLQHPS